MDSSRHIASIATLLDCLQSRKEQCLLTFERTSLDGSIQRLRVVRTLFLCSTLADNVKLRIEANNDNAVTSRRSQTKRMKQKKRRMGKGLGSLLVRVEDMVRRILDDRIPFGCQYDMESLEEEMDKWYTRLSDYLRKYSTSLQANQIKTIGDSVLENLKDFMSTNNYYDWVVLDQVPLIKSVIKSISFLRNFTQFSTLLCAENQEFQYSFTQIDLLVIGAAHFTLLLFPNVKGPVRPITRPNVKGPVRPITRPNVKGPVRPITRPIVKGPITRPNVKGPISIVNPFLHGPYSSALSSLKHSQESCNPTLTLKDYSLVVTVMEDFVVSLLLTLWRMLQSDIVSVLSLKDKLQTVYKGLRFLRITLKNQPDKFDDGKIRDTTVAAICDAGVIIFSLGRKDVEINYANQEFLENIQVIRYLVVGYVLKANFPQTNVLGFLDFLLEEYLAEVTGSKVDPDTLRFVSNIQEHLVFLKSFVGNLLELRNQQMNVHQDLWDLSVEVAYKIESLIDQLVLGDIIDSFSRSLKLKSITEDITSIKSKSLNIFGEGRQDIIEVHETTEKVSSMISSTIADDVVGFESEKTSIIDRLLGGFSELKVVSVVGMPGSGKTTLATTVYKDSTVTHCFRRMAWCSISQVFNRRKVLIDLLNQTKDGEIKSTWDENDLSQELRKSLKGRKYLIFIDDIWDTKAFDLLKESLPDDLNQSRILLTSRNGDVVPGYIPHDEPLLLPLLSDEQSLELLRRKLFPDKKGWPSESELLNELGKEISEYCKGLPLTLVIIAGVLNAKDQECWKDVLKALRLSTISDLTLRTIELSYIHLSDHLKPLFLWFSAYPEDYEISVKEIIGLWISEGLVGKFESESSEEVARGYINILIARGLVMVAGRRSGGGVKTCRIHDLLRDFCLRKATEEVFLHILKVDADENQGHLFSHESLAPRISICDDIELFSSLELRNMRRLCIYSKPELLKWEVFCPRLRSLLFFGETEDQELDLSVIFHMFRLLRVLDIRGIELVGFPSEIGALAQLRYLAIKVDDFVGPIIGNLSNLETLILYIRSCRAIKLPDTIWNLRKLRHLSTNKSFDDRFPFELPDNLDRFCNLVKLETLSNLYCCRWRIMEKQLKMFPNIRRLRCTLLQRDIDSVAPSQLQNVFLVVDFSFLSQLDSLSFEQPYYAGKLVEIVFPKNVKRLTLTGCKLPWSKMSSIAKLPHLAVLKLLQNSFVGETWDLEEEEFTNLKFLKFKSLDIVKWTATSGELFPNLEKLVLSDCPMLQEIPEYCMENVETLKAIEVIRCPLRVESQVRNIEESQKEYGTLLQVHLH